MKEYRNFARLGLCAVALLLLLFPIMIASSSAAQPESDVQSASLKTHAKTEPISNRRVTLQMVFNDGNVASATQLEGGLIRVESTTDKVVYGLTPLIADDGRVNIKVFRIDPIKHQGRTLGESLSEVETLVLSGNEARISNSAFNFGIRLASPDKALAMEKKTL